MCVDIKDYYLCTPMERFEYLKIPYRWIPDEIRLQYGLDNLVEDGGVRKGM